MTRMRDQAASTGCPYSQPAPAAPGQGAGCPAGHGAPVGQPRWDPGAEAHADRTARDHAEASRLGPERAVGMARAAAEQRAGQRNAEEVSELFVRTLGRKLGYGHPLSDRTGTVTFTWTDEAEERLRDVPDFCRELTRWRVEWTAHKLGLGTTITPEVMEVKYDLWGRVSHAIEERHAEGLPWTDEAYARFERIPEFVRGQVLEAIEGNARAIGATLVDDAVVDRVIARWVDTGDFHEGLYGFR